MRDRARSRRWKASELAALARRLGLTDSEVLAVQHLAHSGELTPGQLGGLLRLSSGGITGLIHRLERAGHISRHANTRDRRSVVVRLTPAIAARAADAWAPYVAEIDALAAELSDVGRLARDADAAAHDALAVPLPALWA